MPRPLLPPEGRDAAIHVRQRLPADIRVHQILDAALQTFAAKGFAATRIDDIARRSGLSKGGIYTHFKSKDDIFEALLAWALTPSSVAQPACPDDDPVTVELLIERVVDNLYADLSDERKILTLRLLLADGARAPRQVAQWRQTVIEPHLAAIETLIRRGVKQGTLRESVVARAPWLLLAPGMFAAMWRLAFDDATPALLYEQRGAHVAMLRELLLPGGPDRQGIEQGATQSVRN
jgi:AcrR family transcriptional regulator